MAEGLVTLTWDANSESDLAGYRLYRSRASGIYDKELIRTTVEAGTERITLKNYRRGNLFLGSYSV